jgi:UDP-galactopyranose mutase
MNKKIDFLIVGAGFYGCVIAERIANILKKNVLIIDKRDHIGGNCYSKKEPLTKIEYHKYGTHIFHTSNSKVWNYLNNFTKFNNYKHQVLSNYKNKIFQMPINLETINSFYKKNFSPKDAENFIKKKTKKFIKKKYYNFEDKAKAQIGEDLYKAFIKSYTTKQWGLNPKNLPSNIFNRLPLRFNYNEDYFHNCLWQGIPIDGYTKLFENLTSNTRIKFETLKEYNLEFCIKPKYATIYTGPLDRLFNYKFGKLGWRSLSFKKKIIKQFDYQGNSVINYPQLKFKYTRIHEPKHLHPERNHSTNSSLIIEEYPNDNLQEPYYPINDNHNRSIHRLYKTEIKKMKNFIIGGRLADYAYYDMDMTISAALVKFEKIFKEFK